MYNVRPFLTKVDSSEFSPRGLKLSEVTVAAVGVRHAVFWDSTGQYSTEAHPSMAITQSPQSSLPTESVFGSICLVVVIFGLDWLLT